MARTRSPNYPVIDLESAVDLVTKLEKYAQRHPVPADTTIEKAWGMKAGGSYGYQCIAALRQFGLILDDGTGPKRQIRITEDAAKVVHNHPDRAAILRAAALKPKVHANIAAKYPTGLPPDDTIRTYLLFDHKPPFNPASVSEFISQLRKTITYSGVDLSSQEAQDTENDADSHDDNEKPKDSGNKPPPPKRAPLTAGMTQAVFPLDEGEALIQMPAHFSQESYEDFEAWLKLVLKKAKRTITSAVPEDDGGEDSAEKT